MTTTGIALLAESDVDWLQIIVIMLIFGGSVLGSISKKLIEYFGGGKATKQDDSATKQHTPRQVAKPRPIQPSRPVARPFSTRPAQRTSTRPVAQPRRSTAIPTQPPPVTTAGDTELPELLAEIIGFPKPQTKKTQPQKIRPPAHPKKPTAPPKPRQANLAPRGELRTSKRRPLLSGLPPIQTEGKRSSLRKKPASKHKDTDGRHLIHLEDVADLSDTLHTSQDAYESFVSGHAMKPTPMALRKAVILNEILQPPVSLRADPF